MTGAHALVVVSAGFWIRFLGGKLKRGDQSDGMFQADVVTLLTTVFDEHVGLGKCI